MNMRWDYEIEDQVTNRPNPGEAMQEEIIEKIKEQKIEQFIGKDIDWNIGEQYDSAGDGHCFFHHLQGFDEEGNCYIASGAVVDGELVDVTDIEKVEE